VCEVNELMSLQSWRREREREREGKRASILHYAADVVYVRMTRRGRGGGGGHRAFPS